jgi:methionyl-tRNA formyltransferase
MACAAFEVLARRFEIVGVVVPGGPHRHAGLRSRMMGHRDPRRAPLDLAHRRTAPVLEYPRRTPHGFPRQLQTLGPDLVVVATFPYLLEPGVLAVPRLGAINLHPSLLPRHRGPDPLFWTYVRDDAETGVTVHWMDRRADAGDIIVQQPLPLARGRAVGSTYEELTRRGTALLAQTVEAIASGSAARASQDEREATSEPRPGAEARRLDFAGWSAERAWHVLAGLGGGWGPLLHDAQGRPHGHGPAVGFALGRHDRPPGTVERAGRHWRLYCADGVVTVPRESRMRQARSLLGRLVRSVC